MCVLYHLKLQSCITRPVYNDNDNNNNSNNKNNDNNDNDDDDDFHKRYILIRIAENRCRVKLILFDMQHVDKTDKTVSTPDTFNAISRNLATHWDFIHVWTWYMQYGDNIAM